MLGAFCFVLNIGSFLGGAAAQGRWLWRFILAVRGVGCWPAWNRVGWAVKGNFVLLATRTEKESFCVVDLYARSSVSCSRGRFRFWTVSQQTPERRTKNWPKEATVNIVGANVELRKRLWRPSTNFGRWLYEIFDAESHTARRIQQKCDG